MPSENIVFLDRDGTLCHDQGYTVRPEDMSIVAGAGRAVGKFVRAGYRAVVVTNQSAIGRGMADRDAVERTNEECLRQLHTEDPDGKISLVLYCPHHPDENCDCRKPKVGMVRSASFPWAFDPEKCWMIGDKTLDLLFGRALGIPASRCVLVLTGDGQKERAKAVSAVGPELRIAEDVCAAADFIVG
ncbi:MAG: HAD-IIIA family hydrolase [Bdellovibrionota bacterium]